MWPFQQTGRQRIIQLYANNISVGIGVVYPFLVPNPRRVSFGILALTNGARISDDANTPAAGGIQITVGTLMWFHFEKYQELVRSGWYLLQNPGAESYRVYENVIQ